MWEIIRVLTTKPVDGTCAFHRELWNAYILDWYSMQARLQLGIARPGTLCMQGGSEMSSVTSGGICIGRAEQTAQSEEIHFLDNYPHVRIRFKGLEKGYGSVKKDLKTDRSSLKTT